jgi:hypothetical protein
VAGRIRGQCVTLVIGTDEAGYGPNLGPLTVAATAWQVAAPAEQAEATLTAAIAAAAPARLWGDSKAIYRGGAGFELLERGVLVALGLAGEALPVAWADLTEALRFAGTAPPPEQEALGMLSVPRHPQQAACAALVAELRERLGALGVRLAAVRCRVVQPGEFNRLLDRGLNKSDILSMVTLDLAASLAETCAAGVDPAAREPYLIWCDRHGGRRRYAAQVTRAFATPLVSPLEETPARSSYRIGSHGRIEFSVGGESRTPVAIASMTAKYVRELSMEALNRFWGAHQPGLTATAGYPVDAARWRQDAVRAIEKVGLGWDEIWRRA